MNVEDRIAYRIIPAENAADYKKGRTVPIPQEDKNFNCTELKKKIEDLFETTKMRITPDYPSRKSCLFVLPYDEEKVECWLNSHHSHDVWDYGLLTLKLTGKLIWCDESIFTQAGLPVFTKDLESLAEKYWMSAGSVYNGFSIPEGLFVGDAIIVDIENKRHQGL